MNRRCVTLLMSAHTDCLVRGAESRRFRSGLLRKEDSGYI